jgi:hypothetical protein
MYTLTQPAHTLATSSRMTNLLHHPHHLNLLPTTHRHPDPLHLPIPLQRIQRQPCQSAPHLKPPEPSRQSSPFRGLQNQTPQTHPDKSRMHKDRPHLRRIHHRIQEPRRNPLHLVVPAIQSLPLTPPSTPSQFPALRKRNKVSLIRNQLTIHGEHRTQSQLDLLGGIISSLQPQHRSPNQLTNRRHVRSRSHPQMKAHAIESNKSQEAAETRQLETRFPHSNLVKPSGLRITRQLPHNKPNNCFQKLAG